MELVNEENPRARSRTSLPPLATEPSATLRGDPLTYQYHQQHDFQQPRRASLAEAMATPRSATEPCSAISFLLPSVPLHDPRTSDRRRASEPSDDSLHSHSTVFNSHTSSAQSSLAGSLSPPPPPCGILLRSKRRESTGTGPNRVSRQQFSDDELLEELRDDHMEELMEEEQGLQFAQVDDPFKRRDPALSLNDTLRVNQLLEETQRSCLTYVRDFILSDDSSQSSAVLSEGSELPTLLQAIDVALTDPLSITTIKHIHEKIDALLKSGSSSGNDMFSESGDLLRTLARISCCLEIVQASLQHSFSKGESNAESPTTRGLSLCFPSAFGKDSMVSSSDLQNSSVNPAFNATSSREGLCNPFINDESARGWQPCQSGVEVHKREPLVRLMQLLQTCEDRLPVHFGQEEGELCTLQRQNLAELASLKTKLPSAKQSPSFKAIPSSRRSPSPQALSPLHGRYTRSSRASSPITLSADWILGDPDGEAFAAGWGASASRATSQGRRGSCSRASVSFVPTPPSLVSRGSIKSDGAPLSMTQSPPPRYSGESLRSWTSTSLHKFSAQDADAMSVRSEKARRRMSSSSEMSWGVLSAGHLPAYASETVPSLGSVRKGSSTPSLLAYDQQKSRSSRVSSLHPRTDDDDFHSGYMENDEGSKQDLQMLQNDIDRLYGAIPQLHNQRAQLNNRVRNISQPEDDFENLMDKISNSSRLNNQRALPPEPTASGSQPRRASIAVSEAASASLISHFDPLEKSAAKTQLADNQPSLRPRGRRFLSVGNFNFGSLTMRRRSSLLDRTARLTNKKGKMKDISADVHYGPECQRCDEGSISVDFHPGAPCAKTEVSRSHP